MSDRSEAYRVSDDLVEKVIDAMSNCGSETVGSRMARAAIAVVLEEAAKVADATGSYDAIHIAAAIRALVKEQQG